ncbi:gluconeogenesis factor YvcK family protein [Pseudidiomarina taiwanensis]|uniref:Putative gluconeogenesis factor n=1 Tax=Pseudidiomarina taiwanensis TaxID=337250 RepID=A0A432ZN47_9GAMM|nr:uridine diphosphate-N-acetylglucosamine-binding protein YvcK [Pseudidiomarina taiwanensis]RUO79300.1 hypothetical protein CWI83_01955 [Pseudidiomarina taiwanensis]
MAVFEALSTTPLLNSRKAVVALGGGTGLGRVLAALAFLQERLTGIVATTDDGGSTGMLRRHKDCIAWGDIRNCLAQLTTNPLARDLLNYRFDESAELLPGHNLGNLILHVLDELSARPLDGIALLSNLLEVNTRLLPMSETPVDLVAETADGLECFGELLVDQLHHMPSRLRLSKAVTPTPEALSVIHESDLIIIGPGSFLTSIMPPLLIAEYAQTIASAAAPVIFIDNLVPEHSPAGALSLAERVRWLETQVGHKFIDLIISNQASGDLHRPVVACDCATEDAAHRHQPQKLHSALEQALQQL